MVAYERTALEGREDVFDRQRVVARMSMGWGEAELVSPSPSVAKSHHRRLVGVDTNQAYSHSARAI